MMLVSGTLSNAVKLQVQNNKWMQKKNSQEPLTKKELNERDNWSAQDWQIFDFQNQLEDSRQTSAKTEIYNKIIAGETLTPEEEKYLEQKDPAALEKYRQAKIEKKAYEEKLKRCKTKDEVHRLKTFTMGQYLSSFKKIENDPYIPMSEKLAKAREMLAKARNVQDVEEKFMQSAKYQNMKTEAEIAKEEAKENSEENTKINEDIKENVESNDKTGEWIKDSIKSSDETKDDKKDNIETDGDMEETDGGIEETDGDMEETDISAIEDIFERISLSVNNSKNLSDSRSDKKINTGVNYIV